MGYSSCRAPPIIPFGTMMPGGGWRFGWIDGLQNGDFAMGAESIGQVEIS